MSCDPLSINRMNTRLDSGKVLEFTHIHRLHAHSHRAEREAACLACQYPDTLLYPKQEDRIVGRKVYLPVGFDADMSLGYYLDRGLYEQMLLQEQEESRLDDLREALTYWLAEQTKAKIRAEYPVEICTALPSDDHLQATYAAYPLYRLAGTIPDPQQLFTYGIDGLRKRIEQLADTAEQIEKTRFYAGLLSVLDILRRTCLHYADHDRQSGRLERALLLERISKEPPATTKEALQLLWLYMLISGQQNFGRMDEYLGPFVLEDITRKRTSRDELLKLLCSFWNLVEEELNLMNGRIIIGGPSHVPWDKRIDFSLLAIEATRRTRVTRPQLSLRWDETTPPEIYDAAIASIGEGTTFPILYHDALVTEAVSKSFQVPTELSSHWVPYGCGEYVLAGRSIGSPNSIINLLKCLELALNDGLDPITGKQMGPKTGDRNELENVRELVLAYQAQVEYLLEALTRAQWISLEICRRECSFLAISLLQVGCIESGQGMLESDSIIHGGLIESYGNVNAGQSLQIIDQLVHADRLCTLDDIFQAMLRGKEALDALLKSADRLSYFGNGDTRSDRYVQLVHDHICMKSAEYGERAGFDYYRAVIINNWNNTVQGSGCLASVDGREYGAPLVSGYGALPGRDSEGLPALLRSLAQLDPTIHAGAVHNLKIDRHSFASYQDVYKEVFKVFFRIGGSQLMITCTSGRELKAAYEDPASYPDLIVRVGGFSARFVTLPEAVQLEIIARTDVAYAR